MGHKFKEQHWMLEIKQPIHSGLIRCIVAATLLVAEVSDTSAFYIQLHGDVTEYYSGEGLKGVQVRLVKDSVERETVITSWNGKYEIFLERGYDYLVWFYREDMVTKHVHIDARDVPMFPDVPFYEMYLQMTMVKWIDEFDFAVFELPLGLAQYKHSVRNLNWDVEYTEQRRIELARAMIMYDRERTRQEKEAKRSGKNATITRNRKRARF